MPAYIIDTSIIIKWFNQENEDRIDIAENIYNEMIDEKIVLTAPTLLKVEFVNVLITGKKLPPSAVKEAIKDLTSLPIVIKEPNQKTLEETINVMNRSSLAAYDALFLAMAREEKCKLISDDIKGHGRIKDGSVVMLKDYKVS